MNSIIGLALKISPKMDVFATGRFPAAFGRVEVCEFE